MKKITLFLMLFLAITYTVSAQDTKFENIKISQNPVTNDVLSFESEYRLLVKIEIYNLLGKLVLEKKIDIKNEKNIDVSNIHSGVYFLRIESGYQSKTMKLIKN